jgi:hypothetical protein
VSDDPTYAEAWAEAAASNRRNAQVIATLEFLHPGIRDEEDRLVTVRAVAARKPMLLRLEADAPVDGGEVVEFKPLGFRAAMPKREAGGSATCRMAIDNIGRELWPYVEQAVAVQADATLILRQYLRADPDTVVYGPVRFVVTQVTIANGVVEGECSVDTWADIKVPSLKYTAADWPNLNNV